MPFLQRLSTIVALLPLVHSAAIEVFPRGQILKDVIRFQKCEKLTKPDGWERNQIGYWKDWDSKGAPDDHAQTDMYTKTDDYFYNGKGNDYGGITTYGGTLYGTINTVEGGQPPNGLYVGFIVRGIHEPPKYDEYKQWRFNCFAKNDWEYTDEKYGLCKTYVECRQKDALKINVLGTEEVVREWDLTPGNEIYAKFQDAYNKEKSMCTEDDIDLSATEKKCTVKFECKDNGNKEVMKSLAEEFSKLQDSGITKEETVTIDRGQCELRGDCFEDANRIYRSVPKILNMVAHSVPENPESKFGTEVASIKATVECEKEESLLDRICDALGGIISAGELVEKFSKPLEVAGVVTEIGCGIISELGG